ncbi:MAG TPA: lysophospholipid acyltransferase family protein [Candidatus Eisenbacteria bacterium]|nr:lysophospholipid acyltransferase family protein [Candidatus Eisenbacteria bacterium]
MTRTVVLLTFWGLSILIVGPIMLLHALLTGNIMPLYRIGMKLAIIGVRLIGIKIEVRGWENLQPSRNYIYMSNHVSNLDPPVFIPLIPGRCSVLVKKEVFRVPIFGRVLKIAEMVPVDRSNREAAIESVRAAEEVLRRGLNMVIFPEGTRSPDGRLLPFKKGPFHMATEAGVAVIPVTLLGTAECWPKGTWAIRGGQTTVIFHPQVDPWGFGDRDALMAAVREQIASALPQDQRGPQPTSASAGESL